MSTAKMRTFPSINRALTMWCDHPGTKAVIFLVNHVNRANHLRSATNGAMPPPQGHGGKPFSA